MAIFFHCAVCRCLAACQLCCVPQLLQQLINTTLCPKNCAKLFLSELLQISTHFDNFWQKGDKEAKIMRGALIFHLT